MFIDYYKTLEINFNATNKEIKHSYRLLSKRYHPDMNQGSRAYENELSAVIEAFNILSVKELRDSYDELWLKNQNKASETIKSQFESTNVKKDSFTFSAVFELIKDSEIILYISCLLIILIILAYEYFN